MSRPMRSKLRKISLVEACFACRQGFKTPASLLRDLKSRPSRRLCGGVSEALSLATGKTGTLASLTLFSPWRMKDAIARQNRAFVTLKKS